MTHYFMTGMNLNLISQFIQCLSVSLSGCELGSNEDGK